MECPIPDRASPPPRQRRSGAPPVTAEAPIAPVVSYGRLIPVTVHFDDLDALGLLHNGRYPIMVERAWSALWQERGFRFEDDPGGGGGRLQRRQGAADQL